MLTQNDYRAALLQAYRAFRLSPSKPSTARAYSLAKGIIKPLPETRESAQLRIAFREYTRFSPDDGRRCKEGWAMCWQYAREYLRPY